MATLEMISYQQMRASVRQGTLEWQGRVPSSLAVNLPQICWADGTPWREANLWAKENCDSQKIHLKTIISTLGHLHAYAKWLEAEGLHWFHFPAREADRCLVRFRGYLISLIDQGSLAPSTAQQRMGRVVNFYRWANAHKLLSPDWPMWEEDQIGIKLVDTFGLERTLTVSSTSLSIPNRRSSTLTLEDGLMPVPADDVPSIIRAAETCASVELSLFIRLGFGTGMRLGTLADIRVGTVSRAAPSPTLKGFYCLAVGPGAHPPVETKFGVTGQVLISERDLLDLRNYIYSSRRLRRAALATGDDQDVVFLTRFGKRYTSENGARSFNVELGRLRRKAKIKGFDALTNFHFHRTRCTFATELARAALKHLSVSDAIILVKGALLHKEEKTTLGYIKFIEAHAKMSSLANEFTQKFLSITQTHEKDKN